MSLQHNYPPHARFAGSDRSSRRSYTPEHQYGPNATHGRRVHDVVASRNASARSMDITDQYYGRNSWQSTNGRPQLSTIGAISGDYDSGSWCMSPVEDSSMLFSSDISEALERSNSGLDDPEYDLVRRNEVPPADHTKNEHRAESLYSQGPTCAGDPHHYTYQVGQRAWGRLNGSWVYVKVMQVTEAERTSQPPSFPPTAHARKGTEMVITAQYKGPDGFVKMLALRPNTQGDIMPDDLHSDALLRQQDQC